MAKKSEKKTLQGFEVTITVTPVNTEFLKSKEPTIYRQTYTAMIAPISILEMAHFQFDKNLYIDPENMKVLNNGTKKA